MSMQEINPDVLVPVGKVLLTACFGYSLVQSIRGQEELQSPFERFAIAILALSLFKDGSSLLLSLSSGLSGQISRISHGDSLKVIILEVFQKATQDPNPSGTSTSLTVSLNVPLVIEQAWRTGVWGVMSMIVDWVFLVVSFLLENARDVLWTLILFLFPIACGVYPAVPRILTQLTTYLVELALWFPMLSVVELTTARVARNRMAQAGSWGLYVVAIELLAIILILLIPSVTHRFLSGALSGDLDFQSSLWKATRRIIQPGRVIKGALMIWVLLLAGQFYPDAFAEEPIRLFSGFVTKIRCDGKLLISVVGNDSLIQLDSIPKEIGCGVLLKPLAPTGRTNLILETTSGTIKKNIVIVAGTEAPSVSELHFHYKGNLE